jgi:plasmid stabilization system protein ParE
MTFKLHISGAGKQDIRSQQRWYESDPLRGGSDLAERWLEGLSEEMGMLLQHPEKFPFAPDNGRWKPHLKLRQMVYRPWKGKPGWRVLYVILNKTQQISVVHIRHESRRWLHDS